MPQLRAFGPLALIDDGSEIALGGPKQRAVLAVLLSERGRFVSTDRLVDEVWGENPPAAARQSVQSYVSNLRRLLEGTAAIEGTATGYVCHPADGGLDLDRFEALVHQARSARAARGGSGSGGGYAQAYAAALAVARGRGRTFEGFEDLPSVATEAERLESLRLSAVEEHLEAEIGRGRGPELVAELEALVARHPLRERLWAHLMAGLYQAGRQADALRAYQRARRVLAAELGIEPSPELADLERRILGHDPDLAATVRARLGPAVCPYKGLAPYQAEDAALFHGRRALVERVVALVGAARFAAVVGASGSGKSSLVRAGLIPAAAAGGWRALLVTPGSDPFAQLAGRLGSDVRADPAALHRAAPPGARLLLVIDQFEELFTSGADPDVRGAFARLLADAVTRPDSRVSVAVAVRGDFYGRCAELGPLADLLARHHVLVWPLSPDELREAVVAPAEAAGLELEPGLVEDVLADAGAQPGVLPLLSHALLETWLRREGNVLTRAAYRAAGGLSGAIAATAHAVLGPAEREAARSVVLGLVQPGADGGPDTGRRANLADLPAGSEAVVEKLTAARLLTRDGETVALAHEALLTRWPDLVAWLDDEREQLVERRRLADAAAEWERLGRDPSALLRGPRLANAADLLAVGSQAVGGRERAFVEAGLVQSCHAATRRRAATAGLAILAAVATVAAGLAIAGTNRARDEANVAASRRLAAQSALALGRNDRAPALLLAVEGMRKGATVEARSALGEALVADVDAAAVLTGHEGDVRAAAISTDGRLAASAGIDGRIRVWDVERGEPRHVFGPFGGEQRDVAFRPDGSAVAGVGIDGVLRVWDTGTGALRFQSPAPVQPAAGPTSVAPASPGGRPGGSGGGGGGGTAPSAPGGGTAEPVAFRAVAWSPDGRAIATTATDGQVQVWEADSGRLVRSFASGDAEIRDVAFSPDGSRLAGAGRDGGIRVWTVQGDAVATLRGHVDVAFGVAWSPDGTRLASAGRDRTLRFWTVARASADQVIAAHDAEIFGLAWSSTAVGSPKDGAGTVATAGADRLIRLWDGATGARRGELKGHSSDARSVAFDGRGNLVSSGNDGTVRIWLGTGGAAVNVLAGPTDGMLGLAFSGDGTALAGAARSGDVLLWNVADGAARSVASGSAEALGVAIRPDGGQVAIGGSDGTLRLWDPASADPVPVTASVDQGSVWSVAYFAGGLVSASSDGTVRVSDPGRGRPTLTLRGHERDVFAVAVSPRESVVVSAGRDGTLRRWNLRAEGPGTVILRSDGELRTVAFSPDGRMLAAAGADGVVRLVSTKSWKVVRTLAGHDGEVRTVGFSPDGATLVTGGRDRNVRFWDVGSGELLARVPAGLGDVRAAVYSPKPGGGPLAVAANLGPVRLWPAPTQWLAQACAAAGRNLAPAEWDRLVGTGVAYHRTCPAWT